MIESWRWFGPQDQVGLWDIRQAGARGIVTALHHLPPGTVWSRADIARRKTEIAVDVEGQATGLHWAVVESLPVSEAIKTGQAERDADCAAWTASMENLAAEGVSVICYNLMPVIDWTRTDLAALQQDRARALAFDLVDFAVFDLHLLARPGADHDYPAAVVDRAADRFAAMDPERRSKLIRTVIAGLPGAMEHWTLDTLRARLAVWEGIDARQMRLNAEWFLARVVPEAERLGVRLCCHPDDPPWPLIGLPRIVSTEDDIAWLLSVVDSPANGVTFCTGSLGARPDNDLPAMIRRFGPKIHFLHLRNVWRSDDTVPGSFHEAGHLDGSTDMVAVIGAILAEEARRMAEGRTDHQIPMRPDHGQEILDDVRRTTAPGYPAIGRLKGLAELRGVARALSAMR